MRKFVFAAVFVSVFSFGPRLVFAQAIPNIPDDAKRAEFERNARLAAEFEQRMANMHQLESKMKALSKMDEQALKNVPVLDKKAQDRVRSRRKVNPEDIAKYNDFLGAAKTGILRLFPDNGCVTKNVVRVDGECANFVPLSSSFSFREGAYKEDEVYHDIGFKNGEIFSGGFFSHAILVSLGDAPIGKLTLSHAGLRFLVDFRPDLDAKTARATASRLAGGVDADGFKYTKSVKAEENTTYALRVVAYKLANSVPRVSEDSTLTELKFLGLAMDDRDDIIVTFRIVRKEADGNVTIVWKELSRKEAPKLKFGKGENITDINSAN